MAVSLLRRAAGFLIHGGSWTLRPYETRVIDETKSLLSATDARALEAQLDSLDHVKRTHADRMLTFYFQQAPALPKLADRSTEHCLARFRLSAGAAALTAQVFSHRGLLSSIEFAKDPKPLAGAAVLAVARLPPGKKATSLADQIDAEEHE
jgi:hypothetical protein